MPPTAHLRRPARPSTSIASGERRALARGRGDPAAPSRRSRAGACPGRGWWPPTARARPALADRSRRQARASRQPQRAQARTSSTSRRSGQVLAPLGHVSAGLGWSPPRTWLTACASTGASTASPSRQPPVEPGRLTTSGAAGDPGEAAGQRGGRHALRRPAAADRLGQPGHLAVEHADGSSPASGRSGVSPVPPVVSTTSYPSATAWRRASSTGSPSGDDDRPVDPKPRRAGPRPAPDRRRSAYTPAAARFETRHDERPRRAVLTRPPVTRPPSALGHHPHVGDPGAAVDGLDHVDQRQARRRPPRSAPPSRRRCGRRCAPWPRSRRRRRPRRARPSTACTATGCASGTSSGVRLAAWMPAIRATASASPLGTVARRSAATTCGRQQHAAGGGRLPGRDGLGATRRPSGRPGVVEVRQPGSARDLFSASRSHRRPRSSSMQRTVSPAATSVTSSGTTASALATRQVVDQVRALPARPASR